MRFFGQKALRITKKEGFKALLSCSAAILNFPVSFTKILTPYGRIFLEFVANDLPLFFLRFT
jgi:hypothetical protein